MSGKEAYSPPVDRLLTIGPGTSGKKARFTPDRVAWPNYRQEYQLGQQDVPELIRMLADLELDQTVGPAGWARVHAYRALGQLRAGSAAKAMIAALEAAIARQDARGRAEIPAALEMIGPAVCPDAIHALDNPALDPYIHVALASILATIARTAPDMQEACLHALTTALERGKANDPRLNSGLILSLKLLNATKAESLIQWVYSSGWADNRMLQYALQDQDETVPTTTGSRASAPGLRSTP